MTYVKQVLSQYKDKPEEYRDRLLLPAGYNQIQELPHYKGAGNHSVRELEQLCEQYKEYCHQQKVIKQFLITEITEQ